MRPSAKSELGADLETSRLVGFGGPVTGSSKHLQRLELHSACHLSDCTCTHDASSFVCLRVSCGIGMAHWPRRYEYGVVVSNRAEPYRTSDVPHHMHSRGAWNMVACRLSSA